MATRVYRVEMRDGCGPYAWRECVKDFYFDLQKAHSKSDNHPAGMDDVPNMRISPSYLFACESIESLCKWFSGFLDRIIAAGGEIKEYEVDDDAILRSLSGLQVVFNREKARLICKHSYDGTFAIGS